MADPIAILGAVTGVAGLSLALRREGRERQKDKRAMRVERGWQYLFVTPTDTERERLEDVWVYVMAWNTGGRRLHIEHVGFEFLVEGSREMAEQAGYELPKGNTVWTNWRFEIALNGETVEVAPDGPAVKIWTRLGPILAEGIDPVTTPMRPFAVTVPENYWWGSEGPLLVHMPQGRSMEEVTEGLRQLAARQPSAPPAGRPGPGRVTGLLRLILDGDVERSSEVFPTSVTRAEGSDAG